MLNYVVTFFVLAVLAAIFGFGGLAADFAGSLNSWRLFSSCFLSPA